MQQFCSHEFWNIKTQPVDARWGPNGLLSATCQWLGSKNLLPATVDQFTPNDISAGTARFFCFDVDMSNGMADKDHERLWNYNLPSSLLDGLLGPPESKEDSPMVKQSSCCCFHHAQNSPNSNQRATNCEPLCLKA